MTHQVSLRSTRYDPRLMTKFHVLAAAGDSAEELRSLGLHDAASARAALVRCLAQLDDDPIADHDAALRDPELAELLRREQAQLRDALAESDVSFIVTPVAAEAHFVRDYDGRGEAGRRGRAAAGVDAAGIRGGRAAASSRCHRALVDDLHLQGPHTDLRLGVPW